MRKLRNVLRLGRKELWSLRRDPMMLLLIVYVFTVSIYTSATALPDTLSNASIAIVDEDQSPLSQRIASAFYPPKFLSPQIITLDEMDSGMDSGEFTFVLNIPVGFQRDVLAGRTPAIQLNVDATRMSQAFSGNGYIQQMVMEEIEEFVQRYRDKTTLPVELSLRARFNPTLEKSWFGGIVEIINTVAMLSIILVGAALIREREHGTIEHLLVMPVTPGEIMISKVWSMSLVVLLATFLSLTLVIRGFLHVPIEGSIALFLIGVFLCLFAMTSLGIYMATLARSMPQFGLLLMLTLMPLNMLSGGSTPRESMPQLVQDIMLIAPTTHFVDIGQSILFRGAGLEVVWKPFMALFFIGVTLFMLALQRFQKTISQMA
ncbi:ABC-2 transporter permease [Pseudomonas monteilii]|uniref:ABC transporter permease n=1 Tax=Pseudomonas TaxID=286 RepID=UPI0015E2E802|nr:MULTISPECIES: ABC transporter permease [Pseudomonas]ELS0924917.1 ABC-2 transporter permease [Pseudomonas putida]MBA1316153.1 ABC-2 transporter permease [Pseudomonas monteilii]QUN67060.1 ABC-2 transporter permease [Pseudomonas sp. JS425]